MSLTAAFDTYDLEAALQPREHNAGSKAVLENQLFVQYRLLPEIVQKSLNPDALRARLDRVAKEHTGLEECAKNCAAAVAMNEGREDFARILWKEYGANPAANGGSLFRAACDNNMLGFYLEMATVHRIGDEEHYKILRRALKKGQDELVQDIAAALHLDLEKIPEPPRPESRIAIGRQGCVVIIPEPASELAV